MPQNTITDNNIFCAHCGDDCGRNAPNLGDKKFCCHGCKTVYQLLHDHQLGAYYSYEEAAGVKPITTADTRRFAYLDEEEIAARLISFKNQEQTHVRFSLPQIHCSSCLYLLEHLNKLNPAIISTRVNFVAKEAHIVFKHLLLSLRELVQLLSAIGYEPALHATSESSKHKPERHTLYRLGIAGFCFSNIMMLSLPEYFAGGAITEQGVGTAFVVIRVGLSLPVLFYCAAPFFISAFKGIRHGFLNIDLPIALAIGITFVRSIFDLGLGTGGGYLDSMSGIVFLMLVGRFLQDRTYQAIDFDRDYKSFFPLSIHKQTEEKAHPTLINELKKGDEILVFQGEIIPTDSVLLSSNALLDYSFVSGESQVVPVLAGAKVFAGARNAGAQLRAVVARPVQHSYLTSLWQQQEDKPTPKANIVDILGQNFTWLVLVIAGMAAAYWVYVGEPATMWRVLTTVLIVACPCALLLSSTFTNGRVLAILAKNHFFVRSAEVIEKLRSVRHFVFDKTGTLTVAGSDKVSFEGEELDEEQVHILTLGFAQSVHPLSSAIYSYLSDHDQDTAENEEVSEFVVFIGAGWEAWVQDHHIKVGSGDFLKIENPQAGVYVEIDGVLLGKFVVGNKYRKGIRVLCKELSGAFPLSVLSGDHDGEAVALRKMCGRDATLKFNQSPKEKLEYIAALEDHGTQTAMIGDGLNDAVALQRSSVGIAVAQNSSYFAPAAAAIIHADALHLLPKALKFAKQSHWIVQFSFAFSIVYNIIGLYFALRGHLSPMIAAILMPASSISIVLITYGLTRWSGKRLGL